MHEGELPIDEVLVARLLTAQLPELASLRVRRWPSTGTVNVLVRLSDRLVVRLPRRRPRDRASFGGADELLRT